MEYLKTLEFENQRIMTTEQLAEKYQTTSKRISENFNANKDCYVLGKHYYCLQGNDLKAFKGEYGISVIADNINKLYLWTEKVAF